MNSPENRFPPVQHTGPLAWMVHNRVTASLLMLVFIIGGLVAAYRIKQEVYPEFELDRVDIRVPYPGASPEEVEQGIILVVEEAIRGIDGIKQITATAAEGSGSVSVEIEEGADAQRVYQDIQQAIQRISTFPQDAEKPQVALAISRRNVLAILIYGDVDDWVLRDAAEFVREKLLQKPGITQVDLSGVRDYEIHVDVSRENLRRYNLTLAQVAQTIRQVAVELPGGSIRSDAGEILLRVKERRDWAREFGAIPIITTPSGVVVRLSDIAEVREGFEDSNRLATFDGQLAVNVDVYRVGDQTPIGVSNAAHEALDEIAADFPPGVHYAFRMDQSVTYRQRLDLLLRNAVSGLILVLLVLGLFLAPKLALWVTMAIPTAFLGTILFMPTLNVSINMMSMFAFIMALGLCVDSAIVAGENIYEYRRRGMDVLDAAVQGVREVNLAIAFSMLTNIASFVPLLFMPGWIGKMWSVVPFVVIFTTLIAWIQPILILPAQLARSLAAREGSAMHRVAEFQQKVSGGLYRFINNVYDPFVEKALRRRYLTIAIFLAVLIIMVAYAASGRMGIVLMAKVESDRAYVTATLPYGSPFQRAIAVRDRLVASAEKIRAEYGDALVQGIYANINENVVEVAIYLTDPDIRPLSTGETTDIWREKTGQIPGLQSLKFESDRGGPGGGSSVTVELTHSNIDVLAGASRDLARKLAHFTQTRDIDDGYSPGKQQLSFRVKPEGLSLGLTPTDVARQVRNSFLGTEALRQQRGRNEVTVRVRLPESERLSEYDVEQLLIRTPGGRDVPLYEVAEVERGRAFTSIARRDGRRTVTVRASVIPEKETNRVLETLQMEVLPQLVRDFPGLSWSFQGRQATMTESMDSLYRGFLLALLVIYVLLAIPFRSYSQPLIVMTAIPFGIVGALLGHLIMGYSIDLISMMGMVALAGVVVNNALVMIDYANRCRLEGDDAHDAIHRAGIRRFRPIILSSLTTFCGLVPMIFETSRQARFMIPMAISLGYGILFATAITLILVPCLYLVIEDVKGLGKDRAEQVPAGE
ncbi:MAG TPA: efflux RND transporter permease subunit [Candidatus Latescibacteria bacterium]|nr:efflux RND transporter permease subunit [Candidatus Latescibacterota bacterium]